MGIVKRYLLVKDSLRGMKPRNCLLGQRIKKKMLNVTNVILFTFLLKPCLELLYCSKCGKLKSEAEHKLHRKREWCSIQKNNLVLQQSPKNGCSLKVKMENLTKEFVVVIMPCWECQKEFGSLQELANHQQKQNECPAFAPLPHYDQSFLPPPDQNKQQLQKKTLFFFS